MKFFKGKKKRRSEFMENLSDFQFLLWICGKNISENVKVTVNLIYQVKKYLEIIFNSRNTKFLDQLNKMIKKIIKN